MPTSSLLESAVGHNIPPCSNVRIMIGQNELMHSCDWPSQLLHPLCPTPGFMRKMAMAALTAVRCSRGLLNGLKVSFQTLTQAKHGAVAATTSNFLLQSRYYSVSHLTVQERIEKKRSAALVGGGQKRIDAQHKRASGILIGTSKLKIV